MKRLRRITIWRLCCAGIALLSVATFTPLVIPPGQFEPMFAGLPFTLWVGIVVAMAMILLTLLGTYVHPSRDPEGPDRP